MRAQVPLQPNLRDFIIANPNDFLVVDDTDRDFITRSLPLIQITEDTQKYKVVYATPIRDMNVTIEEDRTRMAYLVFEDNPSSLRRIQLGVLYQKLNPPVIQPVA